MSNNFSEEIFTAVIQRVDQSCRDRSIPMIGPEKAEFLVEVVTKKRPKLVVEMGTAIGYSGLWIAKTLEECDGGKMITIELNPARSEEAGKNFEAAGLSHRIERRIGDASELCKDIEGPVDLFFLDGGFNNYHPSFLALQPNLDNEAVLLADNVHIGENDMQDYLEHVRSNFKSESHWFVPDLPWQGKDAIELSIYRKGNHECC